MSWVYPLQPLSMGLLSIRFGSAEGSDGFVNSWASLLGDLTAEGPAGGPGLSGLADLCAASVAGGGGGSAKCFKAILGFGLFGLERFRGVEEIDRSHG